MINHVKLVNFGPLQAIDWQHLGQINLVIGRNGSGKTFLLKALYSALRTIEEYKRGDNQHSAAEILYDKLYWTFQTHKIGDLVNKSANGPLECRLTFDQQEFAYAFGRDTVKQISSLENRVPPRTSNSIFLPAKEVLSLHNIILESRENDKAFGFDDTYYDLARALRQLSKQGKNYKEFSDSKRELEIMLGGKVEFDERSKIWLYKTKSGNQRFLLGVTAEGIKKISILDTLLSNRYLDPQSVVFIDEVESALHPASISQLLDIVRLLASRGIQFFLASHSYFVIKKLFLIAQKHHISIPVISENKGVWHYNNLLDGMPENDIIDESIHLYEQEIDLVTK